MLLWRKQAHLDPAAKDYGYIEYLRKSAKIIRENQRKRSALACESSSAASNISPIIEPMLSLIKFHETVRDYFTVSLRQVNHLVQIDEVPNLELMEPKWELYKISISFQNRKFHKIFIDSSVN